MKYAEPRLVTSGNRSCGHHAKPTVACSAGGVTTENGSAGTPGGSTRAGRCRMVLLMLPHCEVKHARRGPCADNASAAPAPARWSAAPPLHCPADVGET